MNILFVISGMGVRMKSSVAMLKPVKVMNVRNAREVTMKVKSGYVALYVINGTMKTVLMSKIISSRYIIRLYYLLITCYIYIAEILFIS